MFENQPYEEHTWLINIILIKKFELSSFFKIMAELQEIFYHLYTHTVGSCIFTVNAIFLLN